ncbi:MAG: hypothetical protein ACRDHY_01450, partial [Anaerolineales bacterium]
MRIALAVLCGVFALPGCREGEGETALPGEIAFQWQGEDTQGGATLAARATLCRETGLVELFAVRGDTGIGLALFPTDSAHPVAVDYRVFRAATDPEPRPGANIAIRWLDDVTLEAYDGTGGWVRLDSTPPGVVSGALDAALRSVERPDT